MDQRWVNDCEVAKITGFSVSTLRNDRHLKKGIPYTKRGRAVRYSLTDVQNYMTKRRVDTES